MKSPFNRNLQNKATGAWTFWQSLKALNLAALEQEADRPFHIALVGAPDHTALVAARLARETAEPQDGPTGPADIRAYVSSYGSSQDAPAGALLIHCDNVMANETLFAEAIAGLAVANAPLRLSLARHVPAFRPAAVAAMIHESAWHNARVAALSALPGVVPFADILLPAAALGDMVLLTKNQVMLLLRIAAAYGHPIDLQERVAELLPVVGGAFGWRAVARELVGLVPGGIGVVVKGSVAYAGTYTAGKAAAIFYSTGQTLTPARMRKLYSDSVGQAADGVKRMVASRKQSADVPTERGESAVPHQAASWQVVTPTEPGTSVDNEPAARV